MQLENGTVQRTAQAVAEKMEKDRLYRELNAHTISLNFNPPTISQRVSRIEVGSAYSCVCVPPRDNTHLPAGPVLS